ncbi:T9SS type A sorting domain-containing protein [Tenacibaculum tangerinum]|uniref:T9SS type A sorting domain-containing protein n=1 Tax=Tenacibaculum tangerinum TaxID=3038772 RepID=A0ABY8L3A1_9FLAO|nr:T9SS type A sorting domain-containing protein [Tenacibaculum tangerinum]WGH75909.1 T9SS type A sorting domain-containing protein [Tenacibaculum tangerinum]
MKTRLLYVVVFLTITFSSNSQNLLNTNTWTVGSGSVSGFGQNGTNSENSREYGIGPEGTNVLLWKATPDASSNADGGWNSSYSNIDHTKTYRFVIWLKKTNSNNGTSYFGFHSYDGAHHSLHLSGTLNSNPYFWYGDLPQLNKWYMLVGYVHGSNYSSTINYGAMYDGDTGEKIRSITDFKFKSSATKLRHRTYLYYDTNTSDRQYFYAPRMELVDGNEPPIEDLLGINDDDRNLLKNYLANWTVGSGSVAGFGQNGTTSENSRELGRNHIGEEVILWKAIPDASSNADGGWNTGWVGASASISYRFSVWIKKTTSNNGSTYFGFYANDSGSLRLDGTYNSNPYFFAGDLPKLNRWYLLVGYVHKSSHTGTSNTGGIYDGITGEKVRTITDYKLKSTVTALRHRSYLYYDINILDRQYFYQPRIDEVNGNEPTITELFHINDDSKLLLSYDIAGNQTQAFYCGNPDYCSLPAAKKEEENNEVNELPSVAEGDMNSEENELSEDPEQIFENTVRIYPNPTTNYATLSLSDDILKNMHSINLYNANSVLLKNIKTNNTNIQLDMSNMAVGMYFIHIHLKKGKSITKKIVKK